MISAHVKINGTVLSLEVTQPMGAGGGFHIFVDRYYQGCIVINNGVWTPHLNENTVLNERQVNWIMGRANKT